jgi:hypothetical protein
MLHRSNPALNASRFGDAIDYAEHRSRSHDAVICVYDDAGNVIETHEHKGEFQGVVSFTRVGTKSGHAVKRDG